MSVSARTHAHITPCTGPAPTPGRSGCPAGTPRPGQECPPADVAPCSRVIVRCAGLDRPPHGPLDQGVLPQGSSPLEPYPLERTRTGRGYAFRSGPPGGTSPEGDYNGWSRAAHVGWRAFLPRPGSTGWATAPPWSGCWTSTRSDVRVRTCGHTHR